MGRSPPVCKHTARMVNGGDSKKDSYYAWWASKSDSKAVKQACTRLKAAAGLRGGGGGGAPPFASTMLPWLASLSLTCCRASLHKPGVVRRSPPVCKHTARLVKGGVQKGSYYARRVAKNGLRHGAGVERRPPHLQTRCSHGLLQKHQMLSSKLAQAGVGGGSQHPPHLQTHRWHGEWRSFKKTQTSLRQHYPTTTAVIVIFVFMYIFIAIISMCM